MILRHCPTCSITFALICYADRSESMARAITRKHVWEEDVEFHIKACAVIKVMGMITLPTESLDRLIETYFSKLGDPDDYLR